MPCAKTEELLLRRTCYIHTRTHTYLHMYVCMNIRSIFEKVYNKIEACCTHTPWGYKNLTVAIILTKINVRYSL